MPAYQDILQFWFHESTEAQWWAKDAAFDRAITERFAGIHCMAMAGELYSWRASPEGRLSEIIVLDQFPRNMFRDTPAAFASDPLALVLAQEAIASGADKLLDDKQKSFLYMPFMHSESSFIHEVALQLYGALGNPHNLAFEIRHKQIIDRFGRYPHRNAILGRVSTPEELAFLKEPGSGF